MITPIYYPATPNGTLNNLPIIVSSSNAMSSSFRYLFDVYESGSNTLIRRIKSVNNTNMVGIVDIAPILNTQLDYELNYNTTTWHTGSSNIKTFIVKIGEEYANAPTARPVEHPNLISSSYITVIPAVQEVNKDNYDLDYLSRPETLLTNFPTANTDMYCGEEDFNTISLFSEADGNLLEYVTIKVYDEAGTLIGETQIDNPNTTPTKIELVTIPFGPANLIGNDDIGNIMISGDWDRMELWLKYNRDPYLEVTLRKIDCKYYDKTRFMFINKFGVLDYYSIYLPKDKKTSLTRNNFTKPIVNYSATNGVVDTTRHIETQYYLSSIDRYKVTTEYLQQNIADWLTELFESPKVWLLENGTVFPISLGQGEIAIVRPINITSATYTWKTNIRNQKVFQYDIEWKNSMNRRSIY
jgi:hypothetical protein